MRALLIITTTTLLAGLLRADTVQGTPASLTSADRAKPVLADDVRAVVTEIENKYYDHPGYRHYFWDYMATGGYDLAFLRKYALHYYEHVRVFRLYLAGAMTVVPVEGLQVILSEVIADEFGVRLYGEPDVDGHPELFRRFMRSLGLTESDWEPVSSGKNLLEGVAHYKRVHYGLFRADLVEETVGAIIFGMERTTPHRHSRVLDGLKKFSARTGHKIDWQFFSEHVGIDDYHNNALLYPIEEWFHDAVKVERMIQGATASFDARKGFLDDLAREMGIGGLEPVARDTDKKQISQPNSDLVRGLLWLPIDSLHRHEAFSEARRDHLLDYLNSAGPIDTVAIPAIAVSETMTVIDGHHRLAALAALGFDKVPCCVLDYDSDRIRVSGATKSEVQAYAARADGGEQPLELMAAKSTVHTVVGVDGRSHPIEVLSPLVSLNQNGEAQKQEL